MIQKSAKFSAIFNEKIEIRERCKPGHNHEDCTDTLEHYGGVLNLSKSAKRKLVFVLH